MKTKQQINKEQREYRKRTKNSSTHKYERTINGFLMRKYRNMQSRVTGVQKVKYHLYKGLSILNRKDFYEWSLNSKTFKDLFNEWVKNNYDMKLCPSVDRLDSSIGYELPNMEWVTHSENSRRSHSK
jgi:hypothetical protein